MKRILSGILVFAMLMTMLPIAFAAGANELNMGKSEYTVNVGETVEVPVYLTGAAAADLRVEMIQFKIPTVTGLTAEIVDGAITSDYVAVKSKSINVFYDGAKFTSTASAPLFTIKYTATATGAYALSFNTIEVYVPNVADAVEINAVGTTVNVTEKQEEPPVAPAKDGLYFGEDTYEVNVGETVEVPVYLTDVAAADLRVEMIQFKIPTVAGLTAEIVDGAITSDYVAVKSKSINVFYDGAKFTSTATAPLFTIKYTATTAGTYALSFNTIEIYVPNVADAITLNVGTAEVTVKEGSAPAPTLVGIAVTPAAITVPVDAQADVKAYVESKIEKVVATYSDDSTADVTGYTVTVDGNVATVAYEGKEATIALTMEIPAPTLVSIAVTPKTLTVPVEAQADLKAYVESKIAQVVATYSDDSTKVITDGYTVSVSGTTAVVKYEGASDRIDLTLEAPEEPPVQEKSGLFFGAETYTVEVGDIVEVPVYIAGANNADLLVEMIQFKIPTVAGLTAEIKDGAITSDYVAVKSKSINVFYDGAKFTSTATAPLFTIEYTATAEGTYTLSFNTIEVYVPGQADAIELNVGTAEVTVTAPPAPEKTLESITVNAQTPITIPVGADAVEVVMAAITGVSAVYSDGSVEPVEDYEVTVDGDVATVTYEGKTATLALIIEVPAVDTEMVVAVENVTVPYGTEDVQAYLESILAKVTIKDSKGGERTETATVTYDASNGIATVAYGEFAADVTVVEIVLEGYTATTADGADVIVVPYDVTDVVAYIATKVAVVGNLSDGNTIPVAEFEVVVEETTATVKVGEEVAGEFTVEYTEPPVAAIVGIEVIGEGIVVPYGTEDIVAYITSAIAVNTVDENGEKAPTTAFTVEAVDGVATVTYTENTEFTATVNYDVETAVATATVEEIEIPYTSAEDVAGYIAANVKFAVDYSNNTADETDIVVTAADIIAADGVAVVTVKAGLTVEIAYTIEAAPEYEVINEVADAYGIAGKVLVQIENVADGKVVVINGLQATYFGNGKFAAIVDAAYTVEVVDAAEMPAVAAFGKLHADKVTAFDALVTNDAALLKEDIAQFADVQNYILADINGNGEIEAADALAVNKYSLFGADADVTTWVD